MGGTTVIMTGRRVSLAICIIALVSLVPMSVQAQVDPNAPIGWEMGIDYESYDLQDGDPLLLQDGGTVVRFWIQNNYLTDINIALDYDWGNLPNASHNGEESVSVGGGKNETFSVYLSDVDLWSIEAGTGFDFEISGQLTSVAVVPTGFVPDTRSSEGQVVVPMLHRWEITAFDVGYTISAGTEFYVSVLFKNMGNTADSFTSTSIEDNCPVLTVDEEPLEDAEEVMHGMWGSALIEIKFDASSTHPTRNCKVEFSAKSTGVLNGGLGVKSSMGEVEIEVEARPVGAQVDQEQASVGDGEEPDDPETVTSENFLSLHFSLTPLAIFSAALVRRNWSQTL